MKHTTLAALKLPFGALACAGLLSTPCGAGAQNAPSRIASVKVYPGSATVERVARVPAGSRSYTFQCLPQGLDAASLQVSADAAVRIGESSVQVQDRDIASGAGGCASPLDERWRQAQDEVANARAEVQALELAQSYLKATASGAPDGKAPAPALIASTTDALRRGAQDNLQRQHQAQRRLEAAELALKAVGAERDRLAGPRARVSTVTVTLATERDADLRLSYQVRGPGWAPSYRATLDSATATVRLERLALVAQATGEDWSNVQLTLSTGQPGRATQGRLPRPWTLDIAQPTPKAAPVAAMAMAAPAPASPLARRSVAEDALPSFEVTSTDKAFATEFAVPQRITVPSNGQRVTLALGSYTAPATLITRTAPAMEEAAYLVAELAPPPGVWPVGNANLYRDGAFVGTGRIDFAAATSANGTSSLAFGRDELVTVRAEPVQDLTGSAGFTGSRVERRTRRAYTVENRHKTPVTLQVLHAAPQSRNEKIEVESRYQPQPTDLAWNRNPGTVAWQQPLAAGATAQFSAEHTIRYAKDLDVQERQ